jgi:hypothetical protein
VIVALLDTIFHTSGLNVYNVKYLTCFEKIKVDQDDF